MPDEPVQSIDDNEGREPEPGTALCLSGGGYRAMVFHIGALWRLYEARRLQSLNRISSVSGGSITAGLLALQWPKLSFDPANLQQDFVREVVAPLRALASETIDEEAIVLGLILPGRVSDRVDAAYKHHLFGDATLQDLPTSPRFVINATNIQSGVLWRFMKPYMRDYRVGEVKQPTVKLSTAVAASSAFPPVLSPVEMRVDPASFTPNSGADLQRPPFTTNAGGKMQAEEEPKSDWARHAYRVLDVIDNQVRALRKRQVIDSFKEGTRTGAYWGIRTDIASYQLPNTLPCPLARTLALAEIPTRLKRLDNSTQERLINWGYAVCDAALRKHVDPALAPPLQFPYPDVAV
jgi:NTE family protein